MTSRTHAGIRILYRNGGADLGEQGRQRPVLRDAIGGQRGRVSGLQDTSPGNHAEAVGTDLAKPSRDRPRPGLLLGWDRQLIGKSGRMVTTGAPGLLSGDRTKPTPGAHNSSSQA